MGRHALDDDKKRSKAVITWMTEEEFNVLREASKKASVPRSVYVRNLIFGPYFGDETDKKV